MLHTGDFKMDQLPLDGRITDLRAFARLGEEGVDLLHGRLDQRRGARLHHLGDATSARCSTGSSTAATQRIIVACFASHVHRVQQVLDAAVAHGRKVAYVGRSMVRNMAIARDLGYLNVPAGHARRRQGDRRLPARAAVLISTGSQGEPLSALTRIAQRNHNFVHIERGRHRRPRLVADPGQRERRLPRDQRTGPARGANVVHKGNALVHVSGHASAGELLYCYNIVQAPQRDAGARRDPAPAGQRRAGPRDRRAGRDTW